MSSRDLLPGSIYQLALALFERWIPATSAGMTTIRARSPPVAHHGTHLGRRVEVLGNTAQTQPLQEPSKPRIGREHCKRNSQEVPGRQRQAPPEHGGSDEKQSSTHYDAEQGLRPQVARR